MSRTLPAWRNFLVSTRLCYTQALAVEMVYRFSLVQGFLGVAIGFVGLTFFWLAAGRGAQGQTGYSPGVLIAYFILTSSHSFIHENRLSWNVSAGIRMGKLSASMLRPYPYLMTQMAQAAAQATIRLILLTPIFLALFFFIDGLHDVLSQLTVERAVLYLATLAIAFVAGWLIKIALGLLAFDMTQTWGPELIFLSIYSVASGISYPADLLSHRLLEIASWTPVYYMIGFPALVLLGRVDQAVIYQGLERGALVAVLTSAVVVLMWRRGMKKFEAIGI